VRRSQTTYASSTGWSGHCRPIGPLAVPLPRPYQTVSLCRSEGAQSMRGSPTRCRRCTGALLAAHWQTNVHRLTRTDKDGAGVGTCPRPALSSTRRPKSADGDAAGRLPGWTSLPAVRLCSACTESAIHACSARLPSGTGSRFGTGVEAGQRAGQSAGNDLTNQLTTHTSSDCAARSRPKLRTICAPLGHDPATAITHGVLLGRGTNRCCWRP
jgi:hypothetical protein